MEFIAQLMNGAEIISKGIGKVVSRSLKIVFVWQNFYNVFYFGQQCVKWSLEYPRSRARGYMWSITRAGTWLDFKIWIFLIDWLIDWLFTVLRRSRILQTWGTFYLFYFCDKSCRNRIIIGLFCTHFNASDLKAYHVKEINIHFCRYLWYPNSKHIVGNSRFRTMNSKRIHDMYYIDGFSSNSEIMIISTKFCNIEIF